MEPGLCVGTRKIKTKHCFTISTACNTNCSATGGESESSRNMAHCTVENSIAFRLFLCFCPLVEIENLLKN